MFITLQDVVFRKMRFPNSERLVITRNTVLFRTLEIGGVQARGVELVHLGQQLPREIDRTFLEVVSKRPVTKHFKERMMVTKIEQALSHLHIFTHIIKIIVFATSTNAFLRVARSLELGQGTARIYLQVSSKEEPNLAEENRLVLVHSCICEQKGGVIERDNRG